MMRPQKTVHAALQGSRIHTWSASRAMIESLVEIENRHGAEPAWLVQRISYEGARSLISVRGNASSSGRGGRQ